MIKTINLIKDNLNSTLEIEGILMTMADYRTNLTQEVIDEVKKHTSKENGFWVTYKGGVYDITAFSYGHPGGVGHFGNADLPHAVGAYAWMNASRMTQHAAPSATALSPSWAGRMSTRLAGSS